MPGQVSNRGIDPIVEVESVAEWLLDLIPAFEEGVCVSSHHYFI